MSTKPDCLRYTFQKSFLSKHFGVGLEASRLQGYIYIGYSQLKLYNQG